MWIYKKKKENSEWIPFFINRIEKIDWFKKMLLYNYKLDLLFIVLNVEFNL